MAIDLNQAIQELLDSVNYQKKIQEQLFDIYLNPTPKTVTIYGPDGKALGGIPNVAKWRDVIWKDAQSAMAKTVYVDQVNGSDTSGDGSPSAPFATPQKAESVIPSGGKGVIYLRAGQTYSLDSIWRINNKSITLKKWGTADSEPNPKIVSVPYVNPSNGYEYIGIIALLHSVIRSYEVDFETPDETDTNVANATFGLFYLDSFSVVEFIRGTAFIRDWPLVMVRGWSAHGSGYIAMYQSAADSPYTVKSTGPGLVVLAGGAPVILELHNKAPTDENGNTYPNGIKDVIAGIIRDANGNPRNVISNLVL